MNAVDKEIKRVIKENQLDDWLEKYPWLKGYLGNPKAPIWFIAENPSLRGLEDDRKYKRRPKTPNLQWNLQKGDDLLREAIKEAKLIGSDEENSESWECYITNVIKQPDYVKQRNLKKRDATYWKNEALLWKRTLEIQIENGNPRVFIVLGKAAYDILRFMGHDGRKTPLERIQHYSYIMFRPDRNTGRKPGDSQRKEEFKQKINEIVKRYNKAPQGD